MAKHSRKQPLSDPDIPIEDEDAYDNPQKKSSFNSVCISSLVFAFVGIGVLLSLATWSYITTMASLDDTRKADHTKLHSHKRKNISYHRNGDLDDYILKMGEGTGKENAVSKSKFPNSYPFPELQDAHASNNYTNNNTKFKLNMVPSDVSDGTHLQVSEEPSNGKPIESISADEVRVMQERLIHKKWKMKRIPKEERAAAKQTTVMKTKPTPFPGLDPIQTLV